jgi:hypothetical protein
MPRQTATIQPLRESISLASNRLGCEEKTAMNRSVPSAFNWALRQVCLIVALVAALTALSAAQLSHTTTTGWMGCPKTDPNGNPIPQNATTYSNWAYTDSGGVKHSFPGSDYVEKQETYCPCYEGHHYTCGTNYTSSLSAFSTDNVYYLHATGAAGTVEPVTSGWINPKYKIVGVMYAPPGASSTVSYGNNTVVGATTSFSSSFSTQVGESVSITTGVSIFGFSNKKTSTYSDSYTQESDSGSSVSVTQTTSDSTGLSGYSDPVHGINHDYDYIFLWLNPILTFELYTDQTGKNQVVWTGYGYDLNDTPAAPDMDMIGIQLGCLNGDFYNQYQSGSNTNWLTCEDVINNNLSRSWALKNTDGSSPALTPTLANSSPPYNFCQQTGTDLYYVCQADPFSNSSYGSQEFPPPAGSYTTNDGRFTACNNSNCNATIEYEPDVNKNYTQGYSTTVTGSEGGKYTYSQSFSIESVNGYSGSGCSNFCSSFEIDVKDSATYTWIDQFSYTTNNSQGQTASFAIVGPPEGYTGTTQFVVYQDNLYGTFMFYPGS